MLQIPLPSLSGKRLLFPLAAAVFAFTSAAQAESLQQDYGPRYRKEQPNASKIKKPKPADLLHRWNQIAIDASGFDHTTGVGLKQQLGPGRAARAMAIVHIAMADSVSAIKGGFESFCGVKTKERSTPALDTAISQAAHDTLVALYSAQTATFDAFLAEDLLRIGGSKKDKADGQALGRQIAARVIAMRADDGVATAEPQVGNGIGQHHTSDLAGHWRQDPISLIPLALGGHWGECIPFVIESGDQFRIPAPPAMTSAEYATAFNEVKALGGDGITTPTQRTPEQTFIGIFWAYDGTPSLCAPPRLYNQIAVQIADQKHLNTEQLARLLALVNVAMADTGIAAWDSKYAHDLWRPITGIRESDQGTGPTGTGDGNPLTVGDPTFSPLGAPASNLTGPNFTPPFPSYPSGHAAFGGALFQTLRRFFGTDRIAFNFVSDEFNGETVDNKGNVRPYVPRYFSKLSEAEEENGQSRIYLGIHWSFDKTEGIAQGRKVADYVFDNAFKPTHGERDDK